MLWVSVRTTQGYVTMGRIVTLMTVPISALALRHRMPMIAYVPEFTNAGALMSYGPPRRAMHRRAAN